MPLNLQKLQEKKERSFGSGWSPKEGQNPIRILPHTARYFTEDMGEFCHEFRSHFIKIPGADTVITRCLRDRGDACPACLVAQQNKDSRDPEVAERADSLKVSTRYIFNILDLNNYQAGIQAYETGPMVFKAVMEYMVNPKWVGPHGDMIHPEAGRNWTLTFTPQGKSSSGFNHYSVSPDPDLTNATGALPENYKELLDASAANIPAYMSANELWSVLNKIGFAETAPAPVSMAAAPAPAGVGMAPVSMPPAPTAAAPAPAAAMPAAAPAPVSMAAAPAPAMPAAAPMAAPAAAPMAAAAAPAGIAPIAMSSAPAVTPAAAPPAPAPAPAAEPAAAAVAAAPAAVATEVNGKIYPPGLAFDPLTALPMCYGAYDPAAHPCEQCPDMSECVMKTLAAG